MDRRVEDLLSELASGNGVSPQTVRDRIAALFPQVESEADRIALLAAFEAVMALALRNVGDNQQLKDAICADKRLFAIAEAMGVDGIVDPVRLHYVVEREIQAERMPSDSFAELAAAGAVVLGPQPDSAGGWFKRLFGRQN